MKEPPVFPELRPVRPSDRPAIDAFLRRCPPSVCELSFPNICIWSESEHPRWTVVRGSMCVLVEPDFEPPYVLPPVGDGPLEEAVEASLGLAPRLSRVPAETAERLRGRWRVEPDPANHDYVYRVSDLIELKGKRYDGKRNRIRRFEAENRPDCGPMAPADRDGCRALLASWFEDKANGDPYMRAERLAILRAIDHYDALDLRTAVVRLRGRVAAFTMGTALNPDTALIQVEIADPAVVGLAQWVNREFLRREWPGLTWVNREQDLCHPGLRRAKQSYQPDHLVEKFNVFRD